ncbi:MAG: hypothetical protein LBB63_03880 [Holosporaceae bacterium]|nr:hypothetical protein [Holosporaceae bacterium]
MKKILMTAILLPVCVYCTEHDKSNASSFSALSAAPPFPTAVTDSGMYSFSSHIPPPPQASIHEVFPTNVKLSNSLPSYSISPSSNHSVNTSSTSHSASSLSPTVMLNTSVSPSAISPSSSSSSSFVPKYDSNDHQDAELQSLLDFAKKYKDIEIISIYPLRKPSTNSFPESIISWEY